MYRRYHLTMIAAAALLTLATGLFAQYQTTMQVNTAIYAGPSVGSMQYGGQNSVANPLLPSQERQQLYQSGMTRSEISGGASAAGPMAPGGVGAITSGDSALQRSVGTPRATPSGPMAAPTGSMGYSHVAPARPISTGLQPNQISGQAMGTSPIDGRAR